ncbi:hypothetical protein BS1321_14760 [Peribacillus simplex NBRC 15720 = DSM 1321]|uniref:Uncharacterized protein n=1 Tax=Peribacillus simplex NBRC 15720 = DSM 1321 TaxID=1349754 RepID=A0A223EIJ6_9BACI|nr:hypothetical protein BS1321_14760 [Peribacillus simplex NBRC 15720 = DSM 1321]
MSFSCFGIINFHPFLYKRFHIWGNPFNKFSYFIDFQIDLIYNSNSFSEYMQFSCQVYKNAIFNKLSKKTPSIDKFFCTLRHVFLHIMPCFFALLFIWFNLNTFQILLKEYIQRIFLSKSIFLHFIPLNVIFFASFLHLIII